MRLQIAAFALLAAVTIATASPECQWGPSFWCQNEQSAVKCGQLRYCQQNVWKTDETQKSGANSIECDLCELVVKEVDEYLKENKTEAEVKNLILDLCSKSGIFAKKCDDLVDAYFDEIWKLLTGGLSPQLVCTELNLCSSVQAPKGDTCDICKEVCEILQNYVDSNITEEELKEKLYELCALFSKEAATCEKYVKDNLPVLWEKLKDLIDNDTLCYDMALCSKPPPRMAKKTKLSVTASTECTICELVVNFLKTYVDKNTTEKEVEDAAAKLCSYLPAPYKNECATFLDTYFPLIWSLVKSEFDDDMICEQLKFCNSSSHNLPSLATIGVTKLSDDKCYLCKLVVSFIRPFVDANKTKEDAEDVVKKLCSVLPAPYGSVCDSLIQEYFDEIWKMIEAEFDNDEICIIIGLCTSSSRPVPPSMTKLSDEKCTLCELVVSFIKPFVDANKTRDEVEDAVKKLCSLVIPPFNNACDNLLDQYFPMIWSLVESEFDNDEICKRLGLCTSSSRPVPPLSMQVKTKISSSECTLCELVVSFVQPFVDSNSTQEEVKAAVDKLCTLLPDPYGSDCEGLVNTYFKVIWMLVESEFDNDLICKQLGLCQSSTVSAVKEPSEPEFITCALCEYVLEKLESLIFRNSTKAEIEAAMDKVCGLLPSTLKKDCDEFVEKYGDKIIDELLLGVLPKAVCTLIGLCVGESRVAAPASSIAASSIECVVCKEVLEYVKHLVGENATKQDVIDALEKVCNVLPAALKDECAAFVEEYGGEVVQLIDNEIDPEKICIQLRLCSPSSPPVTSAWKMLAKALRHRSPTPQPF